MEQRSQQRVTTRNATRTFWIHFKQMYSEIIAVVLNIFRKPTHL